MVVVYCGLLFYLVRFLASSVAVLGVFANDLVGWVVVLFVVLFALLGCVVDDYLYINSVDLLRRCFVIGLLVVL